MRIGQLILDHQARLELKLLDKYCWSLSRFPIEHFFGVI